MLREHGVVGKFVEFHGPGLADMPLANRATIANMAPEYGATMGFFPVDEQTIRYLRLTGRSEPSSKPSSSTTGTQGLWRDDARRVEYSAELELDMGTVEPSLAGPTRPQDRIDLSGMKSQWEQDLANVFGKASPAGRGHAGPSGSGKAAPPTAVPPRRFASRSTSPTTGRPSSWATATS
jgi:aconitate hydratase